jgi:ribosomal protein S18 acetylase RimI-like enzyme
VRGDRSLRRLAAGDDGAILAVGALQPRVGRSSHVAELVVVVAARARRLGLGTTLARHLLIAALDNGFRKVVEVAADNVGPIELFRGLGFEPEALLRDQLRSPEGESHDIVVLAHLVDESWSALLTGGVGELNV